MSPSCPVDWIPALRSSLVNVSKTMTQLLPFSLSPAGCCHSWRFEMPYAWPIPCKAILARPLEELSGKGGGWQLSFSYFFAVRRKGRERTGTNSLRRPPGAVLGGGITLSACEERDRARKAPAAAQRCQQGARAAGPPPRLEAGGLSQGGRAARPRCPLPCLHSHLVTSTSPPPAGPRGARRRRGARW